MHLGTFKKFICQAQSMYLKTHLQIIIMSVYIQQINYSTLNVFSMHEHLTNGVSENLVNAEHVLIMP